MKSYLELLEANIAENVEGTGGDVMGFIAKALGIERKAAEARMGSLPIDVATKVADAASQGDTAEIILYMGAMKDDLEEAIMAPIRQPPLPNNVDREDEMGNIINGGPQAGNPNLVDPNDPSQQQMVSNLTPQQQQQNLRNQQGGQPQSAEQQAMAAQQQPQSGGNRPPVKVSGTVTKTRGTQGTGPRQQFAEDFSAGEEVKVNDQEAIISGIDDGPAGTNTVGVLVDGTLEMEKKVKVTVMKKKVEEGILGMASMPSMRQMMELAMFQSKAEADEDEDGDDEKKAQEAEGDDPKAEAASNAEEPKKKEAPAVAQGQPAIAIFDVQTGSTESVGIPAAEIEQPVQSCDPEVETSPREQILKALDVVERNMPDLRVGDFKDVRQRLEKISNVIVEKAMNRRPKL